MNKRICFILIPILALLFTWHSVEVNAAFFNNTSSGSNITTTFVRHTLPFSSNLKKGEHKNNKNAMRIKAWDDAFAAIVPYQWVFTAKIFFPVKVTYTIYASCILQTQYCVYDLRGPPSVA